MVGVDAVVGLMQWSRIDAMVGFDAVVGVDAMERVDVMVWG